MYIVSFKTPVIELEKTDYDIDTLSKEINTSPYDILHKPNWFKIGDEWYYFKAMDKLERFINEILGSFLAESNGIPTAKFKVASYFNGRYTSYGLISKNFKLQGKTYTTTYDLKLPVYDQGLSNIVTVREYFKEEKDYYNFITSLLISTAIDFYMNQIDRVNENLLFIKDKNSLSLAPMFDYSLSMDIGKKSVCAKFDDIARLYTFYYKENERKKEQKFGSAFLNIIFPSREARKLFYDYPKFYETFKRLIDFDMESFLNMVEDNYPIAIPKYLKEHYLGYSKEKQAFIKKMI